MRLIHAFVGAAVAGAGWLVSTPASAGPATANSIQLGVGFRYGFSTSHFSAGATPAFLDGGPLDPWGVGLGLDGGYTLPDAIYLGGNLEYFFGGKTGNDTNGTSANLWQLTAEGGYDIGLGPIFVLRPKLGAGLANLQLKQCFGGCDSRTESNFALLPGATVIVTPPGFRLVADLRYEFVFDDQSAKAVIVTAGIGF